jgi:hypothetical protein
MVSTRTEHQVWHCGAMSLNCRIPQIPNLSRCPYEMTFPDLLLNVMPRDPLWMLLLREVQSTEMATTRNEHASAI